MNSVTSMFVLSERGLVPMQPATFATEAELQILLADHPALLAGDQIDSLSPRRFLLIDREQPIACEQNGPARWALDHLFLDQDGVPTLVEVKRGNDTRLRREVLGQMLDYAANATLYLPVEALKERLAARCAKLDKTMAEVLAGHIASDEDADAFWVKVKDNLQANRIRLLFVADKIPPELRKVVEYLNSEMKSAEVLALELRPYQGEGGLRALAPILLGQTQKAIEQRASPSSAKPRREWDEAQIVDELARYEPGVPVVAKKLIEWMKAKADRMVINDAPVYGSIGPEFTIEDQPCSPLRFWTDGSIAVNFVQLKMTPAFASSIARQELFEKLNAIPGVMLKADAIEKQGFLRLDALSADQGSSFLEAMDWMLAKLRASAALAA